MKVVSVSVGLPRDIEWQGKLVRTSIIKTPVYGRVRVATLNLDGDRQSDLTVHGGVEKAVYVYPSEHYEFWRRQLPDMELPWGSFGENLTIEGLSEDAVNIGDRFRIGSAEFRVTQPRMPCFKLGIRFASMDFVKRFLQSRRTGFYLAVDAEGDVAAGDSIDLLSSDSNNVTVADVSSLYIADESSQELLRRVSELAALPESWRGYFRKRIWDPDA